MEKNVYLPSLASFAKLIVLACGAALFGDAFFHKLSGGYQVGIGFVAVVSAIAFAVITAYLDELARTDRDKRITTLQDKGDLRSAWDLARLKLEEYFDRNLQQVKMIFYVAIGVMGTGFAFIIWGLHRVVAGNGKDITIAAIGSASGVITEFIGATFMVIYRNTMLQATQYVSVLERINTVGMAVGIVEAMGPESAALKDSTRVNIINLLFAMPATQLKVEAPPDAQPKPAASAKAAGQ